MDTGNEILETYLEWLNSKEGQDYIQAFNGDNND